MDGQNFPNTYGANYDKKPVNGFAIAGMVIGILSLVLCCCSEYIGLVLGILAIIFSIIAKKQGPSGMATAGLICGIIALVLSAVSIILGFLAASFLKDVIPNFAEMDYEEMMEYYSDLLDM